MKIWITRLSASSLLSRGLGNVFVWFQEPCLDICERDVDIFSDNYDESLHKKLQGVLYSPNCRHNFIYRKENNVKSKFGTKLIRNSDGIDFPELLIELEKNRELKFEHKVFGDGRKTGYRPTSVGNLFGYDCEIAKKIWELVYIDFKDIPFREWDKHEEKIPWWNFCKEIEIEISLIEK